MLPITFFADRMGNELRSPARYAGALSTEVVSTVTEHEVVGSNPRFSRERS